MAQTSTTYPLRLDIKLMKRAQKLADDESRTVASVIRQALDEFLEVKGK